MTVELTDQDIRDALGGRLEDDPVRLHFNKVIERANLQVLRVNRWNNDAILWGEQGHEGGSRRDSAVSVLREGAQV